MKKYMFGMACDMIRNTSARASRKVRRKLKSDSRASWCAAARWMGCSVLMV